MGGTSSATGGGSGGNTSQVSGNEAFYTKQQKQLQKKTMNTDQKVTTYGDTKTGKTFGGEYSKENQNPNDNIQKQKKKTVTTTNNGGGGGGGGGNINNNTIKQVTETAPTIAEVDQATTNTDATETAETTEANRLLKIKKRGRSASIMNSAKGVTKTSSDYSLGKKSLLGQV
tara:strand:- start:15 stop:530 length:516 start_codon:yes stop_codon:yes gene_type:complete